MKPSPRDHAVGAALCAGYVALLLATAGDLGMSRDEGIYVEAAQSYGLWLKRLWTEPSVALTRESIDRALRVNHEHPPLMKFVFGLGYLAQAHLAIFPTPSSALRLGGMLSAGLLLWLIYVFGVRLHGRAAGAFAALGYALLPRPFYHAHLNAFDVPITLALAAVTYCYHRSLSQPRWALATGACYGLALLTKHNSWVLPGIFAIHFGWLAARERLARRRGEPARVSLVPWGLFAMLTLGPALFFGGWPWLWHDTLPRLQQYAAFHLHHEYYNIEYFGVNYFWPPFPSSYPWLMTLFTVPLTTLALAFAGLLEELRRFLRDLRERADPTQGFVLCLGMLFAPLLIISLPSTPIFGGTKHWFPSYPFMALLAGVGFRRASEALGGGLGRRTLLAAALLAPAAVETAHSHPFGLSHYTVAAGGVPGAADLGLHRQFWGFTTRSVVPLLLRELPHGGTVYLCDTLPTSFQMLLRDGLLPRNIRPTGDIARADLALVHHERHFAEVDHQIWTTYGHVNPLYVLRYDGVPIVSVYKRR